jgi:membrane associated rhomboid family serine protease
MTEPLAAPEASHGGGDPGRADESSGPSIQPTAWGTGLFILSSLVIFLRFCRQDQEDWAVLRRFGVLPADEIWGGGYWTLVTSTFVHHEYWHFGLNVFWLWRLGSRLEVVMGTWKYVSFLLISAFVSSSFQLAASDTIGIGFSGIVYSNFGLMWLTRSRHTSFQIVLSQTTTLFFFVWLIVCIVMTQSELGNVANAAHVSGLLFGCAVSFVWQRPRSILRLVGPTILIVLSVVPLFWCPWSPYWRELQAYQLEQQVYELGLQAHQAHEANRLYDAWDLYTRCLRIEPKNAWALYNRSLVNEALGRRESAQADRKRALEIDPAIEQPDIAP